MYTNANEQVMELKGIIEVKNKIINELNRDMDGTLKELERLRSKVNELEGRT